MKGQTTSYAYNAEGIRTQQQSPTQNIRYLVDQNRDYAQVLAEYNSSGLNTSYSYGDDLISQTKGTATHYYHYDGLGSTRALSDASGIVTDTYAYDAFGDLLQQTGTTENRYRFTGEQYDEGLEQYYLRARYYDQGVERFTQQDSWMGKDSDPITLHRYLYVNGDGVNHVDPSGQMSLMMVTPSISLNTAVSLMQGQIVSRAIIGAALSYGVLAIRKQVGTCLREYLLNPKTKRCLIKIPIVVSANDYPTQRQHIQDAQEGNGDNIGQTSLPAVLHYQRGDINRRSWPRFVSEWRGRKNQSPLGRHSCLYRERDGYDQAVDCDEYPFNASLEGGYLRYQQGLVSARFIPVGDNSGFGSKLNRLKSLKTGDAYLVVTTLINLPSGIYGR